jgi:hypothetical protein
MPYLGFGKGALPSTQVARMGTGRVSLPSHGSGFQSVVNVNGIGAYTGASGDIGISIAGGSDTGSVVLDDIQYIAISTTSNGGSWGTLLEGMQEAAGGSSSTKAITSCGISSVSGHKTRYTQFFSLASRGTTVGGYAWDWTNTAGRDRSGMFGVSSSTRFVCGGGYSATDDVVRNQFSYYTIATNSQASDFGTLTVSRSEMAGVMSTTRGIMCGGETASNVTTNVSDYITIATTGNAANFGNMESSLSNRAGVSNSTRGVLCGGDAGVVTSMGYYTIATLGTATSFGTLGTGRMGASGTSNSTRGVISGGKISGGTRTTSMEYITIASTGNGTSFGSIANLGRYLGHIGQIAQAHGGI